MTSSNGVDTVQLGSTTTTNTNVGDLLRVELQMSSGTGFEWKVASDASNSSPAPIACCSGGQPGVGSVVVMKGALHNRANFHAH